jgi:uncharacterized membrane protein HdeD (DUF308 family)
VTKAPIQLTKSQRRLLQTALGITMVRGFLAIILGLALFFQPDKSRPMLANFMGMYWLVSGVVSLRWGTAVRPVRRLAILAGTIGVLAGLMTVSRLLLQDYVGEVLIFDLMGVILVLTGLLHIFGGFLYGQPFKERYLGQLHPGNFRSRSGRPLNHYNGWSQPIYLHGHHYLGFHRRVLDPG